MFFIIVCLYRPPEQSPWWQYAVSSNSYLLFQMHNNESCDVFHLCGFLNSFIGSKQGFIEEVDGDAHRVLIALSQLGLYM